MRRYAAVPILACVLAAPAGALVAWIRPRLLRAAAVAVALAAGLATFARPLPAVFALSAGERESRFLGREYRRVPPECTVVQLDRWLPSYLLPTPVRRRGVLEMARDRARIAAARARGECVLAYVGLTCQESPSALRPECAEILRQAEPAAVAEAVIAADAPDGAAATVRLVQLPPLPGR
jgi:hypothetical protein